MRIKTSTQPLIDEFFRLVRLSSESFQCGPVAEYLKSVFSTEFGVEPVEQKSGETVNLIVKIPSSAPGPALLLAAHMDTVSPGTGIQPVLKKGRIVSESETILGADDKSAIAVFVQALRIAKQHSIPLRPLEIVFTDGEEMGLLGAKRLDYGRLTARQGLCFDSDEPPGTVTVAAPAYDRFEIEVIGRASHSGIAPEKGLNAISLMAEVVRTIPLGRLDASTTANIGTVRGGRQNNIVPDRCIVTGEVRSLAPGRNRKFLSAVRTSAQRIVKKAGGRMKMSSEREFEGFSFNASDPFLRSVLETMRACGLKTALRRSNGGSDANIFNAAGIRTLNCAIGMTDVHTTKESISVRSLADTLRFLVRFISLDGTEVDCE